MFVKRTVHEVADDETIEQLPPVLESPQFQVEHDSIQQVQKVAPEGGVVVNVTSFVDSPKPIFPVLAVL